MLLWIIGFSRNTEIKDRNLSRKEKMKKVLQDASSVLIEALLVVLE